MNILIIESELIIAKQLENLLISIDISFSIIAIVDSIQTGIAYLSCNNAPDLIFSTIELADGKNLDIYKKVANKYPVIFFSESKQYIEFVFETNAIVYLLKPFTYSNILKALDKYQKIRSYFGKLKPTILKEYQHKRLCFDYQSSILIEQRDTLVPVLVNEMAYLYLKSTIIEINTISSHKYHKSGTLDQQQQILNPEMFYRANRHFIIHRHAIVSVKRSSSRKLVVSLVVNTPEAVIVSKANPSNFLHWLEDVL